MSEFTKGKWEIEGTVPFGIKSEASSRIAIVLKLSDARLIAAAPEMYELLQVFADEPSDTEERIYELFLAVHEARKLLARINGEEANHE